MDMLFLIRSKATGKYDLVTVRDGEEIDQKWSEADYDRLEIAGSSETTFYHIGNHGTVPLNMVDAIAKASIALGQQAKT